MVLAIRTIQNYGNFGSHALDGSGEEISTEDVQPCLNALTQLAAWYGRTSSSFAEHEGHEALAAVPHTVGTTRLADSTLIVVKALLLGCGFDEVLARRNHRVVCVQLPWSDQLVGEVAEGRLDLAIYNEQRLLRMAEEDGELESRVVSVGRLGHSMGDGTSISSRRAVAAGAVRRPGSSSPIRRGRRSPYRGTATCSPTFSLPSARTRPGCGTEECGFSMCPTTSDLNSFT